MIKSRPTESIGPARLLTNGEADQVLPAKDARGAAVLNTRGPLTSTVRRCNPRLRVPLLTVLLGGLTFAGAACGHHVLPATLQTTGAPCGWRITPLPRATNFYSKVWSISQPPDGGAWAVSSYQRGVILHWIGGRWVVVPHPSPNAVFQTVLALSSSDVWFAGNDYALIQHWNGKRVSAVPNRIPATVQQLAGTRPDSIWALGHYDEYVDLAHWNGSTWLDAKPPNFNQDPALAIAARGKRDVWVVGPGHVARWDGSRWHYINSPIFRQLDYEDAVLDLGPSDVWIVGGVAVHFDGRKWKVTPVTALPRPLHGGIGSIAGNRDRSLYAAGESGKGKALVLRWTGKRWGRVPIPLPKGRSSLGTVAVAGNGEVWVGGESNKPARPLIEHYVPCART